MKKNLDMAEIRAALGITQARLAELLDVDRKYVSMIETGIKPLSSKLSKKLDILRNGAPHNIGPPASVVPGIIAEGGAEAYGKPDNWAELFKRLERIETDLALIKKLLTMK